MSLFRLDGQITSIGQSVFNNDVAIYAFLEVTEASGQRVLVEKVAVCNDIASNLRLGMDGEFFVDRLFRFAQIRCQLWGIKTDSVTILDRINLRTRVAVLHLVYGIICLPVFGLGLLLVLPALYRLLTLPFANRRELFFGAEPSGRNGLKRQQSVRI